MQEGPGRGRLGTYFTDGLRRARMRRLGMAAAAPAGPAEGDGAGGRRLAGDGA